jgi:large subunit ribosomal protein L15
VSAVLSRLAPPPGAVRVAKRVGRGVGSGLGKTCGNGQKGQKSRKPGNLHKPGFQGGQTRLYRRLPKRGFRVPFPIHDVEVDVSELARFEAGANVDEQALRAARLVRGLDKVRIKILGGGKLDKRLYVTAHGFSRSAVEKIEKAGGKATTIPFVPTPAG